MAALAEGTLEVEDGCLWLTLDDGRSRYLPIWPHGTSLVQDGADIVVASADRRAVLPVGSGHVILGGGESGPRQTLEELIGQPIPDACAVAPYWGVSAMEGR